MWGGCEGGVGVKMGGCECGMGWGGCEGGVGVRVGWV